MNFIRIGQQDGELIFERLKRAEILFVRNDINEGEIYINIESDEQTETERTEIAQRFNTTLNDFITFAIPKLQFMSIEIDRIEDYLSSKIAIPRGWADEDKMAGIYVGWGIETFHNEIYFERKNDQTFQLHWTCQTDDLNYYDEKAKLAKAEISAELKILRFATKREFWDYEKDKIDGKK